LSSRTTKADFEARLAAHRNRNQKSCSNQERVERLKAKASEGRRDVFCRLQETNGAAKRFQEYGLHGLHQEEKVTQAVACRTGVLSLDAALGGGFPSGAIEVFGEESVGKTTLIGHTIARAQDDEKDVILAPSEYLDLPYLKNLGVDLDKLLILTGSGERYLEAMLSLLSQKKNLILIVDSATAIRPEVDEYDNWVHMMHQWLRAALHFLGLDSCIILVNQVRAKRSIDREKFFAGGTDSAARRIAGEFSTRIELIRENVKECSYEMLVHIVSNVLAAPARHLNLPVVKGAGIDVWLDVVRVASIVNVIETRGSWRYFGDTSLGQGEQQAVEYLALDPELSELIRLQTLRALSRGVGT
jgi:recombination protein RecA